MEIAELHPWDVPSKEAVRIQETLRDQVGEAKGDYTYLRYRKRIVGAVVRTRFQVRPIFVSPGYHTTIDDCIRLTLATCTRYRIPEPTRQANILVNSLRRKGAQGARRKA